MKRYKELKYNGIKYYKEFEIDNILIENNLNWVLDAEIKNTRLEIINKTLVWNAGIWYNGIWEYGVFRSGQWSAGTWKNGVWYNGIWKTGTFENGIIYKGEFINGDIIKGIIRGGNFHEINILDNVKIENKKTENMNNSIERSGKLINDNPNVNEDEKFVEATLEELKSSRYNNSTAGFMYGLPKKMEENVEVLEKLEFPSADDLINF